MAEIIPFRAWRYHESLREQIADLASPLFDVVSEKQRRKLYTNPVNSIHLSVPLGDNPVENARQTLAQWIQNQIIVQDEQPALYAYYQYFNLYDKKKQYCRKGFVCYVKATDWHEGQILRHENTIPVAVNDRIALLEGIQLQASPTHGLYTDKEHRLEPLLDQAIGQPIYDFEDYQGVRSVIAAITDPATITLFRQVIAGQPVILADGHHRYESSVAFRQKQRAQNPTHHDEELYNYHMMYLTNAMSDDLRILPTHRLIKDLPDFSADAFVEKLGQYFNLSEVADASDLDEVIHGKPYTFGIILPDSAYKARLKAGLEQNIQWEFPPEVKELDLTVMHYFIIDKVLGIAGRLQRSSNYIAFERNFTQCIARVNSGEAQMALITNEVSIDEVISVCHSGYTMPQKSTYFYPKVLAGLLYGSLNQ